MTKEEILAMEAGQELDVLVAEEIFGIEVEWDYALWDVDKQCGKLPFRKGAPRTVLGPMAHSVSNTIPGYSIDISAAWQVIEKMRTLDTYIEIGNGWQPEEYWWVRLKPEEIYAWGKILPEAICKAAVLTRLDKIKRLEEKNGN